MKNNTVAVAKNIWDWVQITIGDQPIGDDWREKLDKWISGKKQPTFKQLEDFSAKIRIPLGYFLLKTPPTEKLEILEYRTVGSTVVSNPSRELTDTIHQMESIQNWMRDYLIQNHSEKIPLVSCLDPSVPISAMASQMRKYLKIDEKWYTESQSAEMSFNWLRQRMSALGIIIMMNGTALDNTRRVLKVEEFRAFTLIDEYAPLIFINAADSFGGKLFSLLHEIVHIGLGHNSFFNLSPSNSGNLSQIEAMSNAVAAEILVPMSAFVEEWGKNTENLEVSAKIDHLQAIFKCGSVVIVRRALDKKFISPDDYNKFVDNAIQNFLKFKQNRGSGGNYYNTKKSRIDSRFLLSLDSSVREGRTLFTDAYRMTNTSIDTFNQLVKEVKGSA
jgi:Zn-dependent peptidase ImmA (M78 family)